MQTGKNKGLFGKGLILEMTTGITWKVSKPINAFSTCLNPLFDMTILGTSSSAAN